MSLPVSHAGSSQETVKSLYRLLIEQNTVLEEGLQGLMPRISGLEQRNIEASLAELGKAGKVLSSRSDSFSLNDEKTVADFLDQFAEVRDELDDLLERVRKDSDRYLEDFLRKGLDDDRDDFHRMRQILSGEITDPERQHPFGLEAEIIQLIREYSRIRELAQLIARYQIIENEGFRVKLLLNAVDRYLGHISAAVFVPDQRLIKARVSAYQELLGAIFQGYSALEQSDKSLTVRLQSMPEEHGRFLFVLSRISRPGSGTVREALGFLHRQSGITGQKYR